MGHYLLTTTGDRPAARPIWVIEHWPLLALLVIALALRLVWISWESPVLQGDECEYLRIAENLLRNHRYAGLYEGLQLVYPPLFPILIALASLVTPSFQTAGILVAVLGGLSLVVAMYGLARHLYGMRVGLIAATLGACFPPLVELSGAIYSQTVYIPLVVGGVFFAVRWLDRVGRGSALLCGACFGLAYLTRPEAIVCPLVIAAAFALTARLHDSSVRMALTKTLPLLATTAILAAPYVAYLSIQTGALHFEGKSVMNYTIAQRVNAGMDLNEAQWGIGPALQEDGPLLSPNRWILSAPAAVPLSGLPEYWIRNARRTSSQLRWTLESTAFGGLLMNGLAILGLVFQQWSRQRFAREVLVFTIVAGYSAALLGQHYVFFHYAVPLLPFLLVWASNGIEVVTRWLVAGARRAAGSKVSGIVWLSRGIPCLLLLGLFLLGAQGLKGGGEFKSTQPSELYRKEAGLWLAREPAVSRKVMSTSNEVPFYAGATAMRLPYATEAVALAYIRAKSPDYVVLTRERSSVGPYYYDKWRKQAIPDSAARLVHQIGPADDPELAIYQWRTK